MANIELPEIPLDEIITELAQRAGVPQAYLNTSYILGDQFPVFGCFSTADSDAFTLIEELQKLHNFDTANFDGRLNFILRGGDAVIDIPLDDIVETGRTEQRKDTIEIPKTLNLEYYDTGGDLTPAKQISDRSLDVRSKGEEKQETAVILSSEQAARMASITHKVLIEEASGEFKFSLPDKYIQLTTADVVRLVGERLRITEVEIDEGLQKYTAVKDRASAYVSNAVGVPPSDPIPPEDIVRGASVYEFLDIPMLSDADDTAPVWYNAVTGVPRWQGAVVELSTDGGESYGDADVGLAPAIIGIVQTSMPTTTAGPYTPDGVSTVQVRMTRTDSELESATLAEMMNRKNLAVIGDELVNFGEVNEIEPGLWELSYFLRGRKGTPVTAHAQGERFVMLRQRTLTTTTAETFLINRQLTFRVTSVGNSTPSQIKTETFTAQSQTERAPGYLRAYRSGGNLIIRWQGVGRIGSSARVSQSQHWRGFRVYVNGVARPDQQATELTVPAPPPGATIAVCQINQFTGEGPRAEITV